jgi:signal transduction histidine kinase
MNNIFELIPLTAALVNLALTIFVFSRGLRSALNRVYLVWGLSITIWNIGTYFLFQVYPLKSEHAALFWARFLQVGVIFLPISLYHLSLIMAQEKKRRFMQMLYVIGAMFVAADFGNQFISGVRDAGYAYYSVCGPVFWVFLAIYITSASGTLWMLIQKQKEVSTLRRVRLRWMMIATIILVVFGSNDILPIIGMDRYPFIDSRIYPLGSLAAVFYGLIVAYSVLQYQLLDIHVTLSRFAAQIVRLGFMTLVGFILLLVVSRLAPEGEFSAFAFVSALCVLILSAALASFFFPQFFGKGDDALERRILGDRFEYHARVQNLIQTMRSIPESQFLMEELEELLVNTMKVRSYQIILLDETTRGFGLFHSYPFQPKMHLDDFQIDSPVFQFFQKTQEQFLSCKISEETARETLLERKAREQLKSFSPEFCFPFFSGKELVGVLLLGPKVNEDMYTPHDLRLLTELAYNLGLLLDQIRLRNQLQVAHEQDLLGRMSRGLAHDLNNLLTPVQTLLQLFQETNGNRDTVDELLPVALRNLNTARSYVNEALFFSRASTLTTKAVSLEQTVREAADLVQSSAQGKGIDIKFQGNGDSVIDIDAVLIKRLVCNLLSNAIDASRRGSNIEIQLSTLPKTEISRDWHRLLIIDYGEGISPENLQRVFTPYFTTKNTGDGKRGFGLGLAIARKIVHLHGGNLSIASKEKKGTTVQVDLPSKPNANDEGRVTGDAKSRHSSPAARHTEQMMIG